MSFNVDDFIELATTTESSNFEEIALRATTVRVIRLLHGAIGMATESGEILDAIKKHIFYGAPLDLVNVKEEVGDSLWYQAIILHELSSSFPEVMEKIIAKLKARYPDKFSAEKALNRNLAAERNILEGE